MGELGAAQLAELGAWAGRVIGPGGAAVVAFGLLLVSSLNNIHVEGDVPEIPGLRYSWCRDETQLHLTYTDAIGGQLSFTAILDGDVFRDDKGQIIGHVVDGARVVIDAVTAFPDLVKQGEPRLCSAPGPDRPGSDQGKPYDQNRARQYEDYMKQIVNPPPDGPTPSGYVYYLPNPEKNGEPVSYDDCQKKTDILLDYKGEGCLSSDNLRLVKCFEKGGSGSSGLEIMRPAADAASGGLRLSYA